MHRKAFRGRGGSQNIIGAARLYSSLMIHVWMMND